MKILKSNEIALVDKKTIEETGVPSLVLMENAGRSVFEIIKERFFSQNSFCVVCGSGNNGGDGLVVARYLHRAGKNVEVFILSKDISELSKDNRNNLEILTNFGKKVVFVTQDNISVIRDSLARSDIIVDAIFGTGFRPPVKGYRKDVINLIEQSKKTIVSVDIPSGLDADSYKIYQDCIKADVTVTFGYKKPCHILYPASEYCGEVILCDIGLNDRYSEDIKRELITPETLIYPKREKTSHKYTIGHVAIVGGSIGKSGAVIMAAKSASRSASGLVTTIIPDCINQTIETNLIEEMSYPLPCQDGKFSKDAYKGIPRILKDLKISSVVVGMGMSVGEGSKSVVKEILNADKPVVIDADGINNLISIENYMDILRNREKPTVLTPHIGEFSRLTGLTSEDILENMEEIALNFCNRTKCYLILKFSRMMIATWEGKILYNTTGNPGMATAGTGDILAGLVGGLVNRLEIEEALKLAVYTHGKAGDLAAKRYGVESMKATDMIDFIRLDGP